MKTDIANMAAMFRAMKADRQRIKELEAKLEAVALADDVEKCAITEAEAGRKIRLCVYFSDDGRISDVAEADDDGDPSDTVVEADAIIEHNNNQVARAEAAEARIRELEAKLEIATGLVEDLADDSPCHYDHHGYCQTHTLGDYPCAHTRAKEFLGTPAKEDQ